MSSGTNATTYPTANISRPGPHDVLCGRGGGTNNHSGNVNFRKLVAQHKMRYIAATKIAKPKVAREVVKLWRELTPPGRFLARTGGPEAGPATTKAEGALWHDVGDKKAREKASQCLRERTAEVIPFVKHLQETKARDNEKITAAAARAEAEAADLEQQHAGGSGPEDYGDDEDETTPPPPAVDNLLVPNRTPSSSAGTQASATGPVLNPRTQTPEEQLAILREQQRLLQEQQYHLIAQQQQAALQNEQQQQQQQQQQSNGADPHEDVATRGGGGSSGMSLSGVTPELAAAFGIDPETLHRLQLAAAAQSASAAGGSHRPPDSAMSSQFVVAPTSHHGQQQQQQHLPRAAGGGGGGTTATSLDGMAGWGTFQEDQSGMSMPTEDFNFDQFAHATQQFHLAADGTIEEEGGEYEDDDVYGDNEDEMTLEEYQRSLEDYIAKEVGAVVVNDDDDDDDVNVGGGDNGVGHDGSNDRRSGLEEQRRSSWVKSFHSVDSQSMASISVTSESVKLLGIDEDGAGQPPPSVPLPNPSSSTVPTNSGGGGGENPTMPPPPVGASRSGRLSMSKANPDIAGSNMSLFSDTSMFSAGLSVGGESRATRSSKMSAARHLKSDLSMMSELTDLSDAASKMSIGR